jgi:hypothetical protein
MESFKQAHQALRARLSFGQNSHPQVVIVVRTRAGSEKVLQLFVNYYYVFVC